MNKELSILLEVELLTGNGSQKEKQRLISENLSEEMLYILDVCFNPFVTTKLHKLEFRNIPVNQKFPGFSVFKDLVEDLKKSSAANDSLRARANELINSKIDDESKMDIALRDILMKILTKRMNIGIGAKLINKAIGRELIPDASLMLASDDQKEIEGWDKIYCEEKYDGVRVIAKGNSKDGFLFFTRSFNELDKNKLSKIESHLLASLRKSGITRDIFFDGELTDHNRKSVSGKVTKILKGTAPDNIDDEFLYNVFDLSTAETLELGKGTSTYLQRRANLEHVLSFLESDSPVKVARQWVTDNMDEVNKIYEEIVALGGEGVILKSSHHLYECKRSKSWVKLKEVKDLDLEIVGWYPGEGKREGYIGGFICTDKSKTLDVKIGSGFTEEDLKTLSVNPDSLIGRIAAIQYNVPITDKFGNRSLFLPRFIEVRSDKTEADDISSLF
jgi:DNA ligase-1